MVERARADWKGLVDFAIYGQVNSDADGGRLASDHAVRGIPTMVLVDTDGVELERRVGGTDDAGLRDLITQGLSRR